MSSRCTRARVPGDPDVPGADHGPLRPGEEPPALEAGRFLTLRALAAALVASALTALVTLTGNLWLVLLPGAVAGLVVTALATLPRLDDVELCLLGTPRVHAGDPVRHVLHVHNDGRRPSPPLRFTHRQPGLDPVTVLVPPVPPRGRALAEIARPALHRGAAEVGHLELVCTDLLGLAGRSRAGFVGQRLLVRPARTAPDRSAVARARTDEGVDPVVGAGLDLAGVRDWRPGDDPRRVHWRSTARHGRLVVAERGSAPGGRLVLAVVGPSDASSWEPLLATAAATARLAQAHGLGVVVLTWPAGVLAADAPTGSVEALLDWWARLPAVPLTAPEAVLAAVPPGTGSLVVAAPEEVPAGWWEAVRRGADRAGLEVARLPVTA